MPRRKDDETVRYPFQAAANKFLDDYIGVYSEGMWEELERRYRKLNSQLYFLWKKGSVSSMDPKHISPEDIKRYVIWRRSEGLKDTSIAHDISAIGNLCEYTSGNHSVSVARARYPTLFMKKRRVRLPVLERKDFRKILDVADRLTEKSNPLMIRRYATVVFCICGGLRTQELQHSKTDLLSADMSTLFLDHVKGGDSYGAERNVPIRRECRPIMETWMKVRPKDSKFIFPSIDGSFLTGNTLRNGCRAVAEETELVIDFRKCRRTYAQYLIDEGISQEEAAVILGHSSVKTTEAFYARPREDRVVRKVVEMWTADSAEEEVL